MSFAGAAKAQERGDVILPAGTLVHCTLNEPNFSSKTAEVGDPVLCNLRGLTLFGRSVFPRGAYLSGHLTAEKEPGHFIGKGYLRIEFDRIGFPNDEAALDAKVIAAPKFKVDKQGDILGKGHATRDAIEWMFPPLWPIKVLTLPARGPRPVLKSEQQLTLRVMDDVEIPGLATQLAPPQRQAAYTPPPPPQPQSQPAVVYTAPPRPVYVPAPPVVVYAPVPAYPPPAPRAYSYYPAPYPPAYPPPAPYYGAYRCGPYGCW